VKNDLVSIITPAYNSETTIAETIKSVIAQTYEYWEMIVVDDFSTDKTSNIVKKFSESDERIILITLKVNDGVANARNTAIKKAKGRYIAFLDSDDLWASDKLLRQINFMQIRNCYFSYTAYEIVDVDGREMNKIVAASEQRGYKELLKQNTIGCLTVIIDSNEIANIEMPPIEHEDFALWLTILSRDYVAYGLNENLAKYRKLGDSLSFNKFKTVGWVWKIYRKNQSIGYVRAFIYLIHFIVRSVIKYKKLGLLQNIIAFRKEEISDRSKARGRKSNIA